MDLELSGKVAVITGGNTGIGLAIAARGGGVDGRGGCIASGGLRADRGGG
jgi:NAD(P)-dependent dehydrogenase (short-subunit alcohol dehydrogenase family)